MKKKVAIIMGGYSSEYQISLKSGNVVHQYISRDLYDVYRVHILPEKWVALDDNSKEYPIDKHNFSFTIKGKKITFDVVFNAIHGHPGEDGTILAYLELLKIPHTSAPFYQMALTFNKRDTLSVLKAHDIKTAKSIFLSKGYEVSDEKIVKTLGLPCFVKPNRAGSSFGISKVTTQEELQPALEKAYEEDDEILIEEFLNGTEVSIGVINYKGETKVLAPTEIVSENDFFDYEAKYQGKSQEITPARISQKQLKNLNKVAKKIYDILDMDGFSRSEFIFIGNEPYFLEMNTVPGFTEESILPQQAEYAGISLQNLFHNAIEMALKNI